MTRNTTDCRCDPARFAPTSYDEVLARCESAALQNDLFVVYSNPETHSEVLVCASCRTRYIGERPFSPSHGGGPLCLFIAHVADPEEWVREGKMVSRGLVADAE